MQYIYLIKYYEVHAVQQGYNARCFGICPLRNTCCGDILCVLTLIKATHVALQFCINQSCLDLAKYVFALFYFILPLHFIHF